MIKNRLRSIFLSVLMAMPVLCGAAGTSAWETVKTEIPDAKRVVKDIDIEIFTAPACIIINVARQVDIKVFTILGRVVSAETIPPGTFQLSVGAHGVYIVKVGELTCKVAL